MQDKDFHGFIEIEGEASIKDETLVVTTRSNNPMTGEKGTYGTKEYPILEYFEGPHYLKVEQSPHIIGIFDMNQGQILRSSKYMRLEKAGFDESKQADIEEGLYFFAHHFVYLFKVDPQKSVQLLGSIYQLGHEQELQLDNLRIYRYNNHFYIHQVGSYFFIRVNSCPKGMVYCYDSISYYYTGLKKYMEDSLQGSAWRIAAHC